MPDRTCTNCGASLGVGILEGLCPRCLMAADSSPGDVDAATGTETGTETGTGAAAAAVGKGAALAAAGRPGPYPGHDLDAAHVRRDDSGFPIGAARPAPADDSDRDPEPEPARGDGSDVDASAFWSDRPPHPRIEGYSLLRELKHGGQGVVYLAIQRSTKRKVAIKVLLAGRYASKSERRRFEREIELVASLKHPNVIVVFDSGSTPEGFEYCVMDYVRGVPITAYVREKKLTLEETLALFATVCDAVNHAHQRGVIHRDLKPSNVLVDVDGNVRVLDFGLAKTLTDPMESRVSVTGNAVGTLPYMSPEQTRGNPDEIDTRTDVYALGVMLYEMLTGRHPYPITGDMADVIRNITQVPPGPPSKCWSSESGVRTRSRGSFPGRRDGRCPLDFDVETIVLKALAKERDHRYDNAGELARDVRRHVNGEQILARRATAWYQLRVFSRRHKALVGSAAAILLVLVVAVAVVSWQLRQVEVARGNSARAAEALANFLGFPGDYFADRGDYLSARRLYSSALDQTSLQNQPGTSILMGLIEVAGRRGGATPLLGSFGHGGGAGGFRGHESAPNNVVIVKGTNTALTAGTDGRLIHWDLLTGRAIRIVGPRPSDLPDDNVRRNFLSLAYVATSPDGKFAAAAGNDGNVVIYALDPTPRETGVVLSHPGHQVWMVTLTNGLRVLTGTQLGEMKLWDGNTGELLQDYEKVRTGDASVAGLAFWPKDERYALSGCGNGQLRLWDLQRKQPIDEVSGQHSRVRQINCVAFSPDGSRALSASHDSTVTVWDVRPAPAGFTLVEKKQFLHHERAVWRADFSPDGKRVASSSLDGTVRVWDADTTEELYYFKGQTGNVAGVAFWGDDKVVSTGDGSRDEDRGGKTSALKVWYLGGSGGEALAKGRVTGITVDDDGVASINTDAGPEMLYAGEDGKLHRQRTPAGRASLPRLPVVYGKEETKRPYWGGGGRSGPAREAHAPPATTGLVAAPKDLATLPKGNARLVGLADGKLQIVGFANAGGTTDGSAAVPLRTLEGHRAAVEFAAVSPNGRFIVSADRDRTVRVWDVMRPARGRELEHDMRAAYDLIDKNIDKPSAAFLPLETLRSWYAFCGHEVAISELEKWESLAAGVAADSGNAR